MQPTQGQQPKKIVDESFQPLLVKQTNAIRTSTNVPIQLAALIAEYGVQCGQILASFEIPMQSFTTIKDQLMFADAHYIFLLQSNEFPIQPNNVTAVFSFPSFRRREHKTWSRLNAEDIQQYPSLRVLQEPDRWTFDGFQRQTGCVVFRGRRTIELSKEAYQKRCRNAIHLPTFDPDPYTPYSARSATDTEEMKTLRNEIYQIQQTKMELASQIAEKARQLWFAALLNDSEGHVLDEWLETQTENAEPVTHVVRVSRKNERPKPDLIPKPFAFLNCGPFRHIESEKNMYRVNQKTGKTTHLKDDPDSNERWCTLPRLSLFGCPRYWMPHQNGHISLRIENGNILAINEHLSLETIRDARLEAHPSISWSEDLEVDAFLFGDRLCVRHGNLMVMYSLAEFLCQSRQSD